MEDLLVSKLLGISSHKGTYNVIFDNSPISSLYKEPESESFYIIDSNISKLYQSEIKSILETKKYLLIEASEKNKSLDKFTGYIESLVELGVTRDQTLIAIGGGIIQDISCFLASTLMRGLSWKFYPTTLLAQSDSCIGSKSSINSGDIKNILGTFNPPNQIILNVNFLETLEVDDLLSGIGEMIKVHAINSPHSFKKISANYEKILSEPSVMEEFIYQSLLMKKKLIEIDEFDKGPRNVMNYGHSFGHAIESATNFSIPHGIAVTIGMDMANFVAMKMDITNEEQFSTMHQVLSNNSRTAKKNIIDPDALLKALYKDKKNTKDKLRLILPDMSGEIKMGLYDKSPDLRNHIKEYISLYHQ